MSSLCRLDLVHEKFTVQVKLGLTRSDMKSMAYCRRKKDVNVWSVFVVSIYSLAHGYDWLGCWAHGASNVLPLFSFKISLLSNQEVKWAWVVGNDACTNELFVDYARWSVSKMFFCCTESMMWFWRRSGEKKKRTQCVFSFGDGDTWFFSLRLIIHRFDNTKVCFWAMFQKFFSVPSALMVKSEKYH